MYKKAGLSHYTATIATEPVFVKVVKEIEKAAKAKKAKKEEAAVRREDSARKGKLVSKALEEMSGLSVQAPHTHWGLVHQNYCEDSDSDYMPLLIFVPENSCIFSRYYIAIYIQLNWS